MWNQYDADSKNNKHYTKGVDMDCFVFDSTFNTGSYKIPVAL